MVDRSCSRARTLGLLWTWGIVLALTGCSKKATDSTADAGPVANGRAMAMPSSRASGAERCRPVGPGSFTLGTQSGASSSSDADGGAEGVSDEELPFSVSLGNAVVNRSEFWVTALEQRGNATYAVWARIGAEVDRGTTVELGRVLGDAEPPQIASLSERAVLAVPDADASGRVIKVAVGVPSSGTVEWLGSIAQGRDDSPVFSLAAQDDVALLAWDELEPKRRLGVVRWKRLSLDVAMRGLAKNGTSRDVSVVDALQSPSGLDAEGPQLVSRPAGFWLGFLAADTKASGKSVMRLGVDHKQTTGEQDEERAVVELGKRGIQLLALDKLGSPVGRPIVVTESGAHVETFDLAPTGDGGVVVAYREANSAPGVEDDQIEVVEVKPDGSVIRMRLEDEQLGAGSPRVLTALGMKGAVPLWLGIAGKSGDMSLVSYRPGSGKLGALVGVPTLLGAEPIAREGDALLVARPRAKVIEFSRVECSVKE